MKLITTFIIVVVSFRTIGCEVCGCSATSGSIGIIGSSNYHLVGFNFSGRSFNSTHPDIFGHGNTENSSEFFITGNLLGKFQLSKRFQVYTNIPYVHNQQRRDGKTTITQGLGDITISARFLAFSMIDTVQKRAFRAQIGVGLKAPTGKYSREAHETTNMYPGTGSWDFPFTLNLFYQSKKWNLQFENLFNLTTENRSAYKFGNAYQSVAYAGYNWKTGKCIISTGFGIQFDYLFHSKINGSSKDTYNGGHLLSALPGINFEFNRIFASIRYFQPLLQHLSKGYTKNNGQLSVSIYYTFKTKTL